MLKATTLNRLVLFLSIAKMQISAYGMVTDAVSDEIDEMFHSLNETEQRVVQVLSPIKMEEVWESELKARKMVNPILN